MSGSVRAVLPKVKVAGIVKAPVSKYFVSRDWISPVSLADLPVLLGRNVAPPTPLLPDDVRANGKPEFRLAPPLNDQPPTRWLSAPEAPLRIGFPLPNGSSIVWLTTSRCATSASETAQVGRASCR